MICSLDFLYTSVNPTCWGCLIQFLVFADVDSKTDDDQKRKDNDDAQNDYHHPVVTFSTSKSTGKS